MTAVGANAEESGESLSRGEVLARGALAAGSLYGVSALAPRLERALAAGDDLHILNFFLPFEYLQAELYRRGSTSINDKGETLGFSGKDEELIRQLLGEERQHVKALTSMIEELGGKPVAERSYAFAFRFIETFWYIAGLLEGYTIGAYNGAIPEIKSKEARELACSIVQVEGRHAAAVLLQNGEPPAPEAFDKGESEFNSIASVVKYTGTY
jgi:hypothetical protein